TPIVAKTRMPNAGPVLRDANHIQSFFFMGNPPNCDECARMEASSLAGNGHTRSHRFQAERSVEEAWRYAITLKGPLIGLGHGRSHPMRASSSFLKMNATATDSRVFMLELEFMR